MSWPRGRNSKWYNQFSICKDSVTIIQQEEGHTAVHIAAREGDEHMFKVLHALKANVDLPDHVSLYTW